MNIISMHVPQFCWKLCEFRPIRIQTDLKRETPLAISAATCKVADVAAVYPVSNLISKNFELKLSAYMYA